MSFDFLRLFVPKDRKFFPLFDRAAENLESAGKLIFKLVNSKGTEERQNLIKEIEAIEHIGDEITHDIFKELGKNFITPFDREDIHRLATQLDDVLDYIHGSSKRIDFYKLSDFTPDIVKLASLIQVQTEELRRCIHELKNMDNMRDITNSLVRINSIENHADDIFEHALAKLFEEEKNAIELIKVKELLSMMETATDKCEDVANVIESIVIKMA
jgi:predicted phosphate transport protein (TIGR00153 family)